MSQKLVQPVRKPISMNPYLSACASRSVHLLCFVVVLLLSCTSLHAQELNRLWHTTVGPIGYYIADVAFFPDGERFAVVYTAPSEIKDGVRPCFAEVRLVEDGSVVASQELTDLFQSQSEQLGLAISPDGKTVAIGYNHLVLWEYEHQVVEKLEISNADRNCNAAKVVFRNDGSQVALFGLAGAFIVNMEPLAIDYEVTDDMLGEWIRSHYITPDFSKMGLKRGMEDGTAIVDIRERKIEMSLFDLGFRTVLSPDGKWVYSFNEDLEAKETHTIVYKHNTETMVLKEERVLQGISDGARNINVTSDGRYLILNNPGEGWYQVDLVDLVAYRYSTDIEGLIRGSARLNADNDNLVFLRNNELTMTRLNLTITDVPEESENNCILQIAPNPTSESVRFQPIGMTSGPLQVDLVSSIGQTAMSFTTEWLSPESWVIVPSVHLVHVAQGTYQLVVTDSKGTACSATLSLQ